MVTAAAGGISD